MPKTSQTTIALEHITVKSRAPEGTSKLLLDDVSLSFTNEEHIGVFGRNGAGKTTLARIISGLDKPTSGHIRFIGRRARVMQSLQRSEDHFTRDSVLREIGGYLRKTTDLRRGWQYMDAVNLPRELEWTPPRSLSSGQRRMVALACALAAEPDVLVIDEPMFALDAESRAVVKTSLRKLRDSGSVGLIIISHHPDDLMGLVERLWLVEEGKVLYDGGFHSCPLSALDHCLDREDISVYRWLREREAQGKPIPENLSDDLGISELRAIIEADAK